MSKSTMLLVAAFLAGVVLAGRVRSLPVLDKLPSL
jgi:hypothetical protein